MRRKRPWSKRSRNRAGFEPPQRSFLWITQYPRYLCVVGLYDFGIAILWVIMYPTLGLVLYGVFDFRNDYMIPRDYYSGWFANLYEIQDMVIYITLPSLLVGNFLCLIGKRVVARSLLPTRCQRCPKCFYDLSARPRDDDTCPECGTIAPRRECVRLWCKLLRSRF